MINLTKNSNIKFGHVSAKAKISSYREII